jgi:hypothetical protein
MAGPDVDFDISKTAGSYSQMASVFTGFAFGHDNRVEPP